MSEPSGGSAKFKPGFHLRRISMPSSTIRNPVCHRSYRDADRRDMNPARRDESPARLVDTAHRLLGADRREENFSRAVRGIAKTKPEAQRQKR